MTLSENTDAWRSTFESLGIEVEPADAPAEAGSKLASSAAGRAWFQTLTCFARRGFLRLLIAPGEADSAFYAQLAVPGADADYATTLTHHLNAVSDATWATETDKSPWALHGEAVSPQNLKAVAEVFSRVADHIRAAEEGARPGILAREFGTSTGSGSRPRSTVTESDTTPAAAASPFEAIGATVASDSADPTTSTDQAGAATLNAFRVSVRDRVIHAGLELSAPLDRQTEEQLFAALAHTLTARFDLTLLSQQWVTAAEQTGSKVSPQIQGAGEIRLAMRANIESETGQLAHDLGRYFERLKKFNALGMSLMDVLAPSRSAGAKSSAPRRDRQSRERPARARRQAETAGAEQTSTGGEEVVFSFGGGGLDLTDITSDSLQPGNFTDPRIRREDATTALVDVVLRHPGYSDKNMRQVLSILLDINYYDAAKLTDRAPCLIAWGVSHERAREFKRVIEQAGGRVTLVEPDSLG